MKEGDFVTKTELSEMEVKKKKLIRRKKQGRAKRRFIVFLFILVCVSTIFVVLKAPFFNVKTIICAGQTTLSEEDVVKIAGAKTNVNIFSTGVGTMKRRLAAHPSIAECNVRRLFPNKIKIWVRESKAVACIEQNGMLLMTDKNGQIIKAIDAKTEDATKGVAQLVNFEVERSNVGEYVFDKENAVHKVTLDCIGMLDELGMVGNVTKIDCSDLSDIKLEYEDRLDVLIGGYEDMQYKLTFIKKVIEEELSKYEKARLDYRGSTLYVGSVNEEEPQTQTEKSEEENAESPENAKTEETKNTEEAEN